MSEINRENIIGIVFLFTTLAVIIYIGYVVLQTQVIAVTEYCQGLINNGTINSMSECNITIGAT